MQTTASLKKLTVACLVLLGCGAAVANAQLTLHLIANTATTGADTLGEAVASWTGSPGTGISVAQATAGQQPTFNPNGLNNLGYVTFDGADDNLTAAVNSSTFLPGSESTTIAVLRAHDSAQESIFAWHNLAISTANMWQLSLLGTPPAIHYVQGDLGASSQAIAPLPLNWEDTWHVLSAVRNADGSGEIRIDGAPLVTSGAFTGPLTAQDGTLTIGGSQFDSGDRWAGDLAEVRVYSAALGNLNDIEVELGGTYAISVVPEPSEYAMIFGLACVAGALALRYRRQLAS